MADSEEWQLVMICVPSNKDIIPIMVLSRNVFWGKDGRGKGTLGRGLGQSPPNPPPLPPRKMWVCLYPNTSIHQCLLAGKSLLYPLFCIAIGGGKLECLGEKLPHPHPSVDWTLPIYYCRLLLSTLIKWLSMCCKYFSIIMLVKCCSWAA